MISFLIFACGQDPILDRLDEKPNEISNSSALTEKDTDAEKSLLPPKPTQPKELNPPNQAQRTLNNSPNVSIGSPSSEPQPGVPSSEPAPGMPSSEPQPGVPQDPAPGNPFKDGPLVKLSGEVQIPNWNGEPIRIDIFDGDQQQVGGQRPNVVMMEFLDSDGEFQIDIPERDIPYWIGAYVDIDRDGKPGPNDPSAWYEGNPIMGDRDSSGVVLRLALQEDERP